MMMGKREPPILVRMIRPAVRRLAELERVEAGRMADYCAAAESVLMDQIRSMFGGERVRFHAPSERTARLDATRERVLKALETGVNPREIASRERVSVSWVYRLRGSTRRP